MIVNHPLWRKRQRDDVMKLSETRCFDDVIFTQAVAEPVDEPVVADDPVAEDSDDSEADEEASEPEQMSASVFYERFVKRTEEQAKEAMAADQRSALWLNERRYAITASSFGAAVGHNAYTTPDKLVAEKVWDLFCGNEMTRYGTFHEPDAEKSFEKNFDSLWSTFKSLMPGLVSAHLEPVGLLKSFKQPWMAASPDGLLRLQDADGNTVTCLVEYKCPARLRHTEGHPYARYKDNVPEYYMDQMQGIMGYLNKYPELVACAKPAGLITAAFFVVWQPSQLHVTLVPFQADYWSNSLEPALERWYFDKFLPAAVHRHNGSLIHGSSTAQPTVVLSSSAS